MSLSLLRHGSQKIDQIIAIDLGARSTKAVYVQKNGGTLNLVSYTVQETPPFEKRISRELLTKLLLEVTQALNAKTKRVILVVGAADCLICHADMPLMSVSEMRKSIKLTSKNYFQENLPGHSFDCFVFPPQQESNLPAGKKQMAKSKALLVAGKDELIENLQEAAREAGLVVEQITPGQIGPVNAFEALPSDLPRPVVALIDIGFLHSTINILDDGKLRLTRVVNLGAHKLTSGLAETLKITYSVAEGLKQVMPHKVQTKLKELMSPLCQELRASIDFFEHQQEKIVSEVFVSGGTARSPVLIEILQTELMLPCKNWDPSGSLALTLSPTQTTEIKQDGPGLAVALGAAISFFDPRLVRTNLLAERQEEAELARRDPVKQGYMAAAFILVLMLLWAGNLRFKIMDADATLAKHTAELESLQKKSTEALANSTKAGEIESALSGLNQFATNRLLFASALDAIQRIIANDVQVVHFKSELETVHSKEVKPVMQEGKIVRPGKPALTSEKTTITIEAKKFGGPPAAEGFMAALSSSPWFQEHLRKKEPIRLRERTEHDDPSDPAKSHVRFLLECYSERSF